MAIAADMSNQTGYGTTRRKLFGILASAALVSACGTEADTGEPAAPTTRTYVDATGASVEIPVRPERILAVHANQTGQPLVSLGAPVIASTVMNLGFLDDYDTSGISDVSTADYAVNIEQLATLSPDLIVSFTEGGVPTADGNDYESLARFAPVVFLDTQGELDEVMTQFADVAGVPDEAERQRAEWQQTAERLADSAPAGMSAVFVANYDGNALLGQVNPSFAITRIMTLAGLQRPPLVANAIERGEIDVEVSGEEIGALSADLMLWSAAVLDPADLPLWATLPAVQAGQVASMNAGNNSYDSHQRIAAEIERLIAGTDPSVVDESIW